MNNENDRRDESENQLQYVDFNDINFTSPGTIAGEYLRTFWHPIYRSEDLPTGKAVPIKIMSQKFALFRGATGKVFLTEDRCPHRHTNISTGYIEGNNIRCLFHGWLYDGITGNCLEQPAESKPYSQKVQLKTFPVNEYLKHIWAFLGDGIPPEFPRFPDFESPGLIDAREPEIWPCNYSIRALDSAIDWSHVAFTHRYSPLFEMFPVEKPQMTVEETDFGIKGVANLGEFGNRITYYHMPNANQYNAPIDPSIGWVWHIAWRVPIDDETHIDFDVAHIPLVGEEAEEYLEKRKNRLPFPKPTEELGEAILNGQLHISDIKGYPNAILVQDYVVQVGQGPIPDRVNYRLGSVDIGPIKIRRIWERELKLFAGGATTKRWQCPPSLNI